MIPAALSEALSDRHWAHFILPAYALTALCLCALAAVAFVRLQHWSRAAREDP